MAGTSWPAFNGFCQRTQTNRRKFQKYKQIEENFKKSNWNIRKFQEKYLSKNPVNIFWFVAESLDRDCHARSQRGYPLSLCPKFSEKLIFLTPWYAHIGLDEYFLFCKLAIFKTIIRRRTQSNLLLRSNEKPLSYLKF